MLVVMRPKEERPDLWDGEAIAEGKFTGLKDEDAILELSAREP